jgi:GTP-binding protein
VEPHLGDFYGYIIADIPGLIRGAAEGKGLGHKFLKHVSKTNMLLHLISLEHENPIEHYYAIRDELGKYDDSLIKKEEWVILTKNDLVNKEFSEEVRIAIAKINNRVFVLGQNDPLGQQKLREALVKHLEQQGT